MQLPDVLVKHWKWICGGAVALVVFGGSKAMGGAIGDTEAGRVLFVGELDAILRRLVPQMTKLGRAIVIAHAAFETGWGQSTVARKGNNLFNITRAPSDPAPIIMGNDTEYDAQGNVKPITQRFAAYPNREASIAHYLTFITNKRYTTARVELERGDLAAFITTLYKGGYFTLPLPQYLGQMQAMLASVQKRQPA